MSDAASTRTPAGQDSLIKALGGQTALSGAVAVAGFAGQLVIARSLGPEGYGEYALLFSYSSILGLCATFGLNIVMMQASARHADSPDAAGRSWVLIPLLLTTCLGLLGGAILLLILINTGLAPGLSAANLIAAFLVPLMSIANVVSGLLIGLSRPKLAIVSTFLLRELCALGFTMAVAISGHATAVWTPLLGACIGSVLGLLIAAIAARSHPAVCRRRDATRSRLADTLPYLVAAAPVVGYSVLYLLLNRLDLLLGAHYVDPVTFGAYALAARCADTLMLVQSSANSSCGPHIAIMAHKNDFQGIEALSIRVGRLLLLIGVIAAIPLFLIAPQFLSMFGSEFAQGATTLRIFLVSKLLVLSFGVPVLVHHMGGLSRRLVWIVSLAIVACLFLIPPLAGALGSMGLALAVTLSLVGMMMASALSLLQAFGVRSSAFCWRRSAEALGRPHSDSWAGRAVVVEIFGVPGAGKTVLAKALATRLRLRGWRVTMIQGGQPNEPSDLPRRRSWGLRTLDLGRALVIGSHELNRVRHIFRLLPSKKYFWRFRLGHHLAGMHIYWDRVLAMNDVVVSDQGYIQAVCSLTAVSSVIHDDKILAALAQITNSDIIVWMDTDPNVLLRRLIIREREHRWFENMMDFSVNFNMASIGSFRRIFGLLETLGRPAIRVTTVDDDDLARIVELIECQLATSPTIAARGEPC